jgi:hypothetical protein
MANTAQTSANPLLRKGGGNARLVDAVEGAKPSLPVGAFSRPLPGGTSLVIDRGRGGGKCSVSHPWKPQIIDRGENTVKLRITPAMVGFVMADIDGTDLDDDPTPDITISNDGTVRLYAEITATLLPTAEGYIYGGTVTKAEVKSTTGEVPENDLTGVYYLHISTFTNGRLTAQLRFTSIGVVFQNSEEPNEANALFFRS